MIKPIMRDPIFLARKSITATKEDLPVAQDLLDTLRANASGCVGMAANMIGQSKRIIAFDNAGSYMVMFNPEIVKCSEPYEAEEGCLSLEGIRKSTRYRSIKVRYQNEAFNVGCIVSLCCALVFIAIAVPIYHSRSKKGKYQT